MFKKATLTLFVICFLLLGFVASADPDFGWHLVCGNRILEGQSWCLDNHFSYYLTNYKFYNPSFIFDILLALFYRIGGFVGAGILGSLIFAGTAILFTKALPKKVPQAIGFVGFLAVFFLSGQIFDLGVRSQLASFWFSLLFLYFLQKLSERKVPLWVFPLAMVFWVNSHGGFFLGLVLLGFYAVAQVIQRTKEVKRSLATLASTFAATLINPFTYKVYVELVRHFNAPLNTTIAEWVSPPLLHRMIIFFVVAGLLGWLAFWWYRRRSAWEIFIALIVVFFAALAITARRNLPFFYIFAIYSFLYYLPWKWPEKKDWLTVFVALPLLFLGFKKAEKALAFNTNWEKYCNEGASRYPCAVVKKYPNLQGNVFNTYEWGGFLIWQWPEAKVFIDGRMPAWMDDYNSSTYETWLYILQTRPGWEKILEQYQTTHLLIGNGVFLDLLLQERGVEFGWQELYRDEQAAFYGKISQ
ncbi:MAG: hypothetical protein ABH814_03025 [bacterium]